MVVVESAGNAHGAIPFPSRRLSGTIRALFNFLSGRILIAPKADANEARYRIADA
jgi:hypothetical protein